MKKVEFFKHTIGEAEKAAVLAALDSNFLTTGEIVNTFEEKFSTFVGMKYTVGLNSCTAALHLALLACDIGPGDEVITTPMTFVATSLAIIHCGATPVWVDVEPTTGNLDAAKIEAAITPRTKAILPVHLYGQMCDMVQIRAIADKHKLYVIEDAAHALIASRNGIHVGQLSDVCCFSFYATKSITCGEGGAATTNNPQICEFINRNRSHGLTSDAASRFTGKYTYWDVIDFGWKYNMDNIKASMLIPQLARAEAQRLIRKNIFDLYKKKILAGTQFITCPYVLPEDQNNKSDYHLFTVWVPNRDAVLAHLQYKNIGVTVNYRSINLLTALENKFGYHRGSFPHSESIGDHTLSLPLHCALTENEIDYVCDALFDLLLL